MKTRISWTCGNYDPVVEIDAPAIELVTPSEQNCKDAVGILEGFAFQVLQRKPAGAWEKAVAGYEKRPSGFKRDSIPYSEEGVEEMKRQFTIALGSGVTAKFIDAIEHVKGEVADSKFTEETEIASRHESAGDLEVWLEEKARYTGDTHGEDGEFAMDMLRAVRAYKIKVLAERKASL
jgi:hypothetical protein